VRRSLLLRCVSWSFTWPVHVGKGENDVRVGSGDAIRWIDSGASRIDSGASRQAGRDEQEVAVLVIVHAKEGLILYEY
jgi:hypothetical protein